VSPALSSPLIIVLTFKDTPVNISRKTFKNHTSRVRSWPTPSWRVETITISITAAAAIVVTVTLPVAIVALIAPSIEFRERNLFPIVIGKSHR
jgi:hypothetical protein